MLGAGLTLTAATAAGLTLSTTKQLCLSAPCPTLQLPLQMWLNVLLF